jgi:hypothetical protein
MLLRAMVGLVSVYHSMAPMRLLRIELGNQVRFRPWVTVITLCETASAFKRIAGFRPVISVAAIIWIESKTFLERESHDFLDQSELRLLPAVRKRYKDSESERFYLDYAKAQFSIKGLLRAI